MQGAGRLSVERNRPAVYLRVRRGADDERRRDERKRPLRVGAAFRVNLATLPSDHLGGIAMNFAEMYEKRLDVRVAAVNKANKVANELYPVLRQFFEPLVGQTIRKADQSLLKRLEDKLAKMPNAAGLWVFYYTSTYSLAWTVKVCEWSEGYTTYHEVTVYVGKMKNGVLEAMCEPINRRTDYNAEEIRQKRRLYEAAKKAADEAKSDLGIFEEYDR
jgi:hypothetical protein